MLCYRLGFTPSSLFYIIRDATNIMNMKLRSYKEEYVHALFNLISLTLKILKIYIKSSQESNIASEVYINDKHQMLHLLKRVVHAWINEVIGGTVFGCEVKSAWYGRGSELIKSSEELQVIMILMFIYT